MKYNNYIKQISNMINKIKFILSQLIGVNRYAGDFNDIPSFLEHLTKDTILQLKDDLTEVEQNAIGDIEITIDDKFYVVNVKTQDISKVYSVPNLISIKKAKDILTNYDNHIIYVFIEYERDAEETKIVNVKVQSIESLDWSYLAIQNLGKGQLQIKNTANGLSFNNEVTRTQWIGELKDKSIEYYNNLILKITEYKSDWEDG